nr:hypothetical protein [Sneathiella glossodoripedis]
MPWEEAQGKIDLPDGSEDFWTAIRGNLSVITDARLWHQVVYGSIEPVVEDQEFLNAASELLPEGHLDTESWKIWTTEIKDRLGVKGKALFMPLRLALTGQSHGPEMAKILPLIGREKALKRLSGQAA